MLVPAVCLNQSQPHFIHNLIKLTILTNPLSFINHRQYLETLCIHQTQQTLTIKHMLHNTLSN
jgi:hypothetical protein